MNTDTNHTTRTLWLMGLLHAFTHLYQVALMPLYLLIQRDFKFQSVGQATVLMTVLMAACFGPSYPVGILADRLNRKKLLGYGLAVNGLGFIALAFAPTFGWALAAVIVAGLGGSFYHPAATALVARLFPTATGKALGLVGIGSSIGFFFGPLYAGWRAGRLEPALGPAAWRHPVFELGIMGLFAAAVFAWLAQNEQPLPRARGGGADDQRGALPRRRYEKIKAKAASREPLFPSAAVWFFFGAYCFAFSLRDFAGASMGSLGSLFLQNAHGYSPQWTGLALSAIYLASAVSNPLFGRLSDRGRKRWIALALVVAAMLMALFPRVPARWTIPVFVLYGFFFMASYPMTEAALIESVPDAVRGRVFGLFVMAGGVLGNLSHWAVGAKVRHLGETAHAPAAYFSTYTGLALLLLCSLSGLLCLNPLRKREPAEPKHAGPDSLPLLT